MAFETLYIDLAGSLIPVLIRVVYGMSLWLPWRFTCCKARSVGRHLTTAWGKQGVE